jgi:cysteine synthase
VSSDQAAQAQLPGDRRRTDGFAGHQPDLERRTVEARPHKIQGTARGFIPNNLHLKDEAGNPQITECIKVTNDDAFAMAGDWPRRKESS